jgi:hypothetical protein
MPRTTKNNMFLILLVMLGTTIMTACSYTSEKALNNGDVINMNGPIFNFSVFESFLESFDSQQPATVRITNFTPEGTPTFFDLDYDGSLINLKVDKSNDKNRGQGPAKVNMTCTELTVEEGQQVITYSLEGCASDSSINSFELVSVTKEQWGEDQDLH